MRKALQSLVVASGLAAIFISLLHIVLGPAAIPGSVPVNATMDSEDRFYATLFLAFGVAIIWCGRKVRERAGVAYFLLATFFVGGLARLISMAEDGPPNALLVALTIVEITLPHLLGWMQRRVTRSPTTA